MRAVIAVIGKDAVGILAAISSKCAERGANIIDVTQTVMEDLFVMIMLIEISKLSVDFADFADELKGTGGNMNLQIHVMHEEIFNSMHKI